MMWKLLKTNSLMIDGVDFQLHYGMEASSTLILLNLIKHLRPLNPPQPPTPFLSNQDIVTMGSGSTPDPVRRGANLRSPNQDGVA